MVARTVVGMTISAPPRDLTDDETRRVISRVVTSGKPLVPEQIADLTDNTLMRLARAAGAAGASIARLEAIQVRVTALLTRRNQDPADTQAKLAQALNLSALRAGSLVAASQSLTTRFPKTFEMMENGLLDFEHAAKVSQATKRLSDDVARAIDAEVAPRLMGKNPDQVGKAAYYAARKVAPAGVNSRSASTASARRRGRHATESLTLSSRNSTSATLTLAGIPTETAVAAFAGINEAAKARKSSGESRSLDQLCADVAIEQLLAVQEKDGQPRPPRSAPPGRSNEGSHPKSRRGRGGRSRRQSRKAGTTHRRAASHQRKPSRRKRI